MCARVRVCVCVHVRARDLETSTKRQSRSDMGYCTTEKKCMSYFKINFGLEQTNGIKRSLKNCGVYTIRAREWTVVTSFTAATAQRDTKENYIPFHIRQNSCTPVECVSL